MYVSKYGQCMRTVIRVMCYGSTNDCFIVASHDFGTDTTNNNHNFDKGGISNGGWLSAVSPASSTGFYMVAENLFKYNANAMKRLEASDVDFMVGLASYCIIQGFEIEVAGLVAAAGDIVRLPVFELISIAAVVFCTC